MFNTTYIDKGPSYSTVTTHEHRAPTDESIRLLNEMQDKAIDNIVERLSSSNNTLQAEVAVMHEPANMDRVVLWKMTLNGKSHKGRIQLDDYGDTARILIEQFSQIIATEVLSPIRGELTPRHNQ